TIPIVFLVAEDPVRLGLVDNLARPGGNLTGSERPDVLFVVGDAFFNSRRVQLANLASRHAIPAAYPGRDFAEAGGLMSYAASTLALSMNVARLGQQLRQLRHVGRDAR